MNKYYVTPDPIANGNKVEAWSNKRLPYQPNEDMLLFRNSIRESLKNLQPSASFGLQAIYISKNDLDKFDVENVLFYNVGTPVFRHLRCKSISFERVIDEPPNCNAVGNWLHYVKYTSTDERALKNWRLRKLLVKWEGLDFIKLNTSTKPELIWNKFRLGINEEKIKMVEDVSASEKELGLALKVTIHAPENTDINLASVVKPLFDGIIASFSSHEGDIDRAAKRLALKLKIDEQEIYDSLRNSKIPILGTKKLLGIHGNGIQWYPDDDLLVAGVVAVEDNNPVDIWKLSGELFTVERLQLLQFFSKATF